MEELEKKIIEADHRYCKKINTYVGFGNFTQGAKSPEAKAFHTQGMYTEIEVYRLLFHYATHWIISGEKDIDVEQWFEQNRKKS